MRGFPRSPERFPRAPDKLPTRKDRGAVRAEPPGRTGPVNDGGPGQLAPLFDLTDTPSNQARDQSSNSASESSSRTSWCSRSYTPASCQARSRCHAVCPDPQPNSSGRSRQRQPVSVWSRGCGVGPLQLDEGDVVGGVVGGVVGPAAPDDAEQAWARTRTAGRGSGRELGRGRRRPGPRDSLMRLPSVKFDDGLAQAVVAAAEEHDVVERPDARVEGRCRLRRRGLRRWGSGLGRRRSRRPWSRHGRCRSGAGW
jgi:hypothetical protein